ncbi:MAG: DUF4388 domain-containing protein [Polyangiaceae bacterium]
MREARAELVRIDAHGVVHPIGTVASQRLRAREGAYRMLPAPAHVVLMRYTGEDGRRDAEDGAIVRLAGEITSPGTMCDVLALLGQTGWRGELIVLDGEATRAIFFDGGNVVGAQTTVDEERLGMVMYRFGAIDEAQHEAVMEKVRAGSRFGQGAIELGVISEERLYKLIGKQIDEIVFATFAVSDGTFFFLDGFDEGRLVSHHTVSANALLMDGVTRLDEMRFFRVKIPSSEHVPVKRDAQDEPGEEFKKTWDAIDGLSSIEELGRLTGRGEFTTTKDVYAMIQSKHVRIEPPRMSGGPEAVVGVANLVLERVHQAADAAGKGTVLRQSLESFAVGGGVYDILFRGAGPMETGALEPEKVAENSVLVAGGTDPERFLKQSLHEYVSFALFAASNALGNEADAQLEREVSGWVNQLKN